MRKRLLLLGIAAGAISFNASAQLALETFSAGVLPPNWVLISDGHTVNTGFANTAIQDSLDVHAWIAYSGIVTAGDHGMLTTSYFNPAATADRWLITPSFTVTDPNMVIQWDDNDLESGEYIQVLASPTAGTTAAAFTSTLYNAPAADAATFVTHQVVIGQYNGQTIRIAFRDHTDDNWGLGLTNVETAVLPYSLDLGVTSLNTPPFIQTGSSNTLSGVIHNYGGTTITAMHLNYSINGGAPVATALTGLSFVGLTDYNYTSGTPWVPSTAGAYTVKVWADNLNGSADQNNSNDTLTTTITVLDSLQPKTVLIEEFNQASCDPCAEATPNVDSVYANNVNNTTMVRYHVNFPGTDYMDDETLTPFVQARINYYGVDGVPDAKLDGVDIYPGAGYFTTAAIQADQAQGSPFKISVTGSYSATTHTYSLTANVTSYASMPSGLKLRAALAIDDITYAENQSTESIPQYDFPQVAENMFPNETGTTLGAFTSGQTQTISSSWVKNHPWGADEATWKYDSSSTARIVVWVQDDNSQYVYQSAFTTVSEIFSTSINTVTGNNGSFDVSPNPAANTATVALDLKANADVRMEMYNMAGQMVYSMPAENRPAGISTTAIDLSKFANGQYFVNVTIGNEVLTKRLVITK